MKILREIEDRTVRLEQESRYIENKEREVYEEKDGLDVRESSRVTFQSRQSNIDSTGAHADGELSKGI